MILHKIAPVLLLALAVGAEKKIELQDIEEDNLKSEKGKDYDVEHSRSEDGENHAPESVPLDFLKNGFLRYFNGPSTTQTSQNQRYVQQYDVTEPTAPSEPQYEPFATQQAKAGYLSNVPMQVYLVPQYYQHAEQSQCTRKQIMWKYQLTQRQQQRHTFSRILPPTKYVTYSAQPTVASTPATVVPVLTYQVPIDQYQTGVAAPTHQHTSQQQSKLYHPSSQYSQSQIEDDQENDIETHIYFTTQSEGPYTKLQSQENPRYYDTRTPVREEYTNKPFELPHPSPLLLKAPPPHLAHIPKVLPIHRPLGKPVYNSGRFGLGEFIPRPIELYRPSFKRKPTSLLDSYVPSSLQYQYLKRGIIKDPLVAYEALSSGHFTHPLPNPKHFQSGFLPNQMFHTAEGGTVYGHYKRSPKAKIGSKT
ncbi:unnamed protein product [Parnassius apollo]|uniref:(apollo) hypothetical protein n=1 Tax=Parnassius apollo TaxID=110799 RepID=A0A8S3X1K1_PARAO|nr:unnamed protein product [Parnassius apollo]